MHMTREEPMLVAAGGGWFMLLKQITFFLFSLTVAHGTVPPTHPHQGTLFRSSSQDMLLGQF